MFEKLSDNASNFVKGEKSFFPEFVHKDNIYFKLVKQNEIMDKPTIQCLEIVFSFFVRVSEQMLKDHLQGVKYDAQSVDLISKSKLTPTTNAEAECDIGMLDILKKLKPRALDLTIEGMVMFSKNNTKDWLKSWMTKR